MISSAAFLCVSAVKLFNSGVFKSQITNYKLQMPTDTAINTLIFIRLIHFITGIVWVGFLYYLVLVHQTFMRTADATVKPAIVTQLLPRTLWWFRWASVITVLSGIWYWMKLVGSYKRNP